MKRYIAFFCLLGCLLTGAAIAQAQTTVVCLGDSITRGMYLKPEDTFPAQLEKLLQDAKVINAGVPGNTSAAGLARFDADVAAQHPQYVVIFFGTNDSVLKPDGKYKVPLAKFTANLQELVQRTRALKAQPILCTLLPALPDPYFKRHPKALYDSEGGLDAVLGRYRDATIAVGAQTGTPVVDLYTPFAKDTSLLNPAPDGVHPNVQGVAVIAAAVAKTINEPRR